MRLDGYRARTRDAEARAPVVGALRLSTDQLRDRALDVARLFEASRSVTAREFDVFTRPLVAGGAAAEVALLETVEPAERDAFARATGVRPFRLLPGGEHAPVPAGQPVVAVRYGNLPGGGRPAVGFDALSSPQRAEAIRRAIATGTVAVTLPLRLVATGRTGFVLYAPVARAGPGRAVRGVVAIGLQAAHLAAVARESAPKGTAVAVAVSGRPVVGVGRLHAGARATSYRFGGRSWVVRVTAGTPGRVSNAVVVFVGGVLITLLAAALTGVVRARRLLRAREDARHRAERRFGDAFASAPIGMAIIDPQGQTVRINAAYCGLLGRSEADVLQVNALSLVAEPDRPLARDQFARAMAAPGSPIRVEARALTPQGERWLESYATYQPDEDRLLIQSVDVTERRAFEQTLRHQAEHDSLTDLLNRRGLHRVLAEHLAAPAGPAGAILLLDLDHFKTVNDLHGHHAGDEVLRSVGRVLLGCVREHDTVARLGGDEFAVLMPTVTPEQARAAAERLVDAVRTEAQLAGLAGGHGVPASVGVAMLDATMTTPGAGLMAADLAMYDAKDAGRGRYAVYDGREDAPSATRDRLLWVERVRTALAERRLRLVAQPIRDLATGEVRHHELLVRLVTADGAEHRPDRFLGISEQFGLVQEIDMFVARRAVELLDRHRDSGLVLHANLSGRSLGDPRVLAAIRSALGRSSVPTGRLVFEITETAAVASLDDARAFAQELAALGCRLALDDFGSGFGSFVYLKQLPFDLLKIDGEFVRHSASSAADRVILAGLVQVARGLGKTTVAEWVTDPETEDLVRRLGVDFAQGHHVGPPVPVEIAFAPGSAHVSNG